ncbi:hypothetical protein TWF481_012121 [Arthrobotrys musiformis]|uniref:Mtf2-like C-terminal domain-containing protein n=1 Tax=Arthrobotrys musiformis TaxID=47236 RepID=A0AAV9VY30_9PEZI
MNTVKSITRGGGRIPPSETILPFLYPPAARYILHRPSPLSKRYYSSPPDQPSTKYNLESSAWNYLLGESTEEEEATLKPKKVPSIPIETGRTFKSRGEVMYRGNARRVRDGIPDSPSSFSHRRSTHKSEFSGYKSSSKDGVAEDASLVLSQSPRTNMTEREKVIFDMIFDKLLQRGPYASPAKKLQHARPSPMVSALFESAVGPQGVDDEVSFGPVKNGDDEKRGMEALLSRGDFPASLRSAAAGKLGLSRKAVGLDAMDDCDSPERIAEYEKLSGMLELCGNDLEVWEWFDEYIFSMPSSPAGLNGNYPKLLREGIQVLREEYTDFPACTAVFDKVKRLGAESYIIGCSVGVYNEMLKVRWKGYRDMSGVLDLLEEMRVNGVDGDEVTAGIVADVLSDVRVFESNGFLPGTVMVWRTEGVLEGKERLREMMGMLVREGDQRRLGDVVM